MRVKLPDPSSIYILPTVGAYYPITMKGNARLLAILLLLSVSPTAALAFRCDRSIIIEGKSIEYVLEKCGQPSYSRERIEYRVLQYTLPGTYPGIVEEGIFPVIIQEWTYNFGPTQLMKYLRFEDGILTAIETTGRGYYE